MKQKSKNNQLYPDLPIPNPTLQKSATKMIRNKLCDSDK